MTTLVPSFLDGSFLFLQVIRPTIKAWMNLNFWRDYLTDFRASCPRTSEKSMNNVLTTLEPSFLIGSSATSPFKPRMYMKTRRTTIKAWMNLNFVKIPSPIMELAPLEHLKFDG